MFDEIKVKVRRLVDIGMGYLSLMRSSSTLSMGEVRRIKLSSLMGSNLTGIIYILDEPTIGLHQRDTGNLIKALKQLRDIGNTVLVVEHDIEVVHESDYIIEVGPLAGANGGKIVAEGLTDDIIQSGSITGRYMVNPSSIRTPRKRRRGNGKFIEIIGAKKHNLKNIHVTFSLETMIGVTGVSGSGKSTLIFDILKNAAENYFNKNSLELEGVERIEGLEYVSRVVTIDQAPIGLTPRSNISTYTGIYTEIRKLYSKLPCAVAKKLKPGHFSFNIRGGRCDRCQGAGAIEVNMHFTQNSEMKCPLCHGKRFKKYILECLYKGYSISDVLDLTVDEAYNVPYTTTKIYETIRGNLKENDLFINGEEGFIHTSLIMKDYWQISDDTLKMYLDLNSQKDDNKYRLYKRKVVDPAQYFENHSIVYMDGETT